VIWYPAEPGTGSPAGSVLADADVKHGRWPVLLFSHGLCGIPTQSTFFTTTMASWGFVVAAPPHPGGQFTDGFPQCLESLADSFENRLPDMQFLIDQLLAANRQPGSRFARHLKPRRIGMSGHSFGGQTTMRVAAADSRVRAALALAPALYGQPVSMLRVKIPTMIMTGDEDTLAPFDVNARPYYAELFGPRFLVKVINTGHSAFADLCRQDCNPGNLTQDEVHALVLRHAVPFLLRYVAGRGSVRALLKPENAPAGAPIVDHALR
jgi:predicted dienelactone hydrolase